MVLHPSVVAAFEEIDAAIFSGDSFHTPETLDTLKQYLARWGRALPELTEMAAGAADAQ